MLYYVIEMQDGAVLSVSYNRTQYEAGTAVSDFYSRCASAAISSVGRHTIMFVDDMGHDVMPPVSFKHGADT